jgi:hypothetical protein
MKERSRKKASENAIITRMQSKTPIQDFLVENSSTMNSSYLKNRLLKEGILKNKCALCGQGPEWNGKPLSLQLDHIDGVHNNNSPENLRLLCPNCHSQTVTFCRRKDKKRKNVKTKIQNIKKSEFCNSCGKPITNRSKKNKKQWNI